MTSFEAFFGLAAVAVCGFIVFGIMSRRGDGDMEQRASYFVYTILTLFFIAFVVLAYLFRGAG
jgi:type IV secretory pathway VirB2 component (pilin)